MTRAVPMGRPGQPIEVAAAVAFFPQRLGGPHVGLPRTPSILLRIVSRKGVVLLRDRPHLIVELV